MKSKGGFTLLELLVVVAIIGILGGIAVVNVIKYQRDLRFMEANAAAKELFISAQNHLTSADSLGALVNYEGEEVALGVDMGDGVRAVTSNIGEFTGDEKSILNEMLPFGSIDDTFRIGSSYAILYDFETATILDVYCSPQYNIKASDIATLKTATKDDRKFYRRINSNASNSAMVGWYGGEDLPVKIDKYLQSPVIQVVNGDTLRVEVKGLTAARSNDGPNAPELPDKPGTSVIVIGTTSGAMRQFPLVQSKEIGYIAPLDSEPFVVTLDDITQPDGHLTTKLKKSFPPIEGENDFIPGEDLMVYAVSYDNTKLSNVAESAHVTVNSLFSAIEKGEEGAILEPSTIEISSIRHLENLDTAISGVSWLKLSSEGIITIPTEVNVVQTTDLDWDTFPNNREIDDNPTLYFNTGEIYKLDEFIPIQLNFNLNYDGLCHRIKGLKMTSTAGDCGIFTAIDGEVKNLELVNCSSVASGTENNSGNAGVLAGTMSGIINNVVTHREMLRTSSPDIDCKSQGGCAGGLVGQFSGEATYAASAMLVAGNRSAGGLFGTTTGKISHSYSGGKTLKGKYEPDNPNVRSETVAGGLVGKVENCQIADCYSTCSADALVSGGFAGQITDSTITDSYTTGYVSGVTKGIFAGGHQRSEIKNCSYYKTAKQYVDNPDTTDVDESQVQLFGDAEDENVDPESVSAFDSDTETYWSFVGETRAAAYPYDIEDGIQYQAEYPLKSVEAPPEELVLPPDLDGQADTMNDDSQSHAVPINPAIDQELNSTPKTEAEDNGASVKRVYGTCHYGDWPLPELLAKNKK